MADFYEKWLAESERIHLSVEEAPRVARGKDLKWEKTRQDARAALMIAPETGFTTCGSLLMKAEIPVGWHTGKHAHGEEAIYILKGRGFLSLDDSRYDFREGTALHIPYRSPHQLVNTGDLPVVYLSGLAWPLEAFANMGLMEQLQDCGPNDPADLAKVPAEQSQYWPKDERRISIHQEQLVADKVSGHGASYRLMSEHGNRNGFRALAVGITSIFVEAPRSKSHSHAHPEAYLYALQGKGYSEIGGKRYEWEEGDAVHVPPGMMHHQHFNPSDGETKELRFGFGLRYWFVDQWKGYTTIDRHLRPSAIDDD